MFFFFGNIETSMAYPNLFGKKGYVVVVVVVETSMDTSE